MKTTAGTNLVLLICTAPTREIADQLSKGLLEEKLAACVTQDAITSSYRWQGALEEATEIELKAKTTLAKAQPAMRWLAKHHPYDVPELLCVPVIMASPAYTQWVEGALEDDPQ